MNVQNIPRSDKVIKRGFIPKLDALLYFDYSQIEFVLLAYYCALLGDYKLVEAINAGRDLHVESARGCLGLTRDPTDDERQIGKHTNYSIIFGGGVGAVIRQVSKIQTCTEDDAKRILKRWHSTWPGVSKVQDQLRLTLLQRGLGLSRQQAKRLLADTPWKRRSRLIRKAVEEGGFITTIGGRQLHPESDHKALNVLIQGGAAELIRDALRKVHREFANADYVSHMVNVVHDEIQVDAVEDEIPRLVEVIPPLMDNERVSSIIPIKVDVEITTTNWAEKESYESVCVG